MLLSHCNVSKDDVAYAAAANRSDGAAMPVCEETVLDEDVVRATRRVARLNRNRVIAIRDVHVMDVNVMRV